MTAAPGRHLTPLVGITGRRAPAARIGAPGGFADAPLDVYFAEYESSIRAAGGIPVHLPVESPVAVLDRVDALLLAGGEDIEPVRYGEPLDPRTTAGDPLRDEYELALVRAAVERGVPVLGVCRGQQLINVAFGGTLVQHVESEELEHASYDAHRGDRVHEVSFVPGSTHAALYGASIRANSFHHQAVGRLGEGLVVTGTAEDDTVEAIELAGRPVLGVQWHPEAFGGDPAFEWLVREAAERAAATD